MEIEFLGGAGEVGRSAILLNTDSSILLDCGLKIHDEQSYPLPPPVPVETCIVSHPHLDHCGFLPSLFDKFSPDIIGTPPCRAITDLLLLDSAKIIIEETGTLPYKRSSHKRAINAFKPTGFHNEIMVNNTKVTLFDAGHIPGSALVLLEYGGKRILYTGDFKLQETRMMKTAEIPKDIDILITESTYVAREHPKRRDLEVQLVQHCDTVLDNGGNVLLPAFAVGRTQELIRVLMAHRPDYKIWVDGMGVTASQIMYEYPKYIRDPHQFQKDFERCNIVTDPRQRKKVLDEPCIIVSTAGMLQGGPALGYLLSLNDKSEIIFTGYCVDGTNGYNLLQYGFVEVGGEKVQPTVPIHYLDFSAHAGRADLYEMVEKTNPDKVFCVHGDQTQVFADELALEGFDATAPKLGEKFTL
jgi:putative mRNA 3-end processing factor